MKSASAESAFWDSSALVLLCVDQRRTGEARRIYQRSKRVAIWWGTPVETKSALQRLSREGALERSDLATGIKRLIALHRAAREVLPTEEVRALAGDVLERTDLRAADAFQLAAALVVVDRRPQGRWFVCFDQRLRGAADSLGFTVMPA